MAVIIPTDISGLSHSKEHKYEIKTLKYLQKNLSDDYWVFHSIHWSRQGHRRHVFGEIDFVIVGKSGKVVIIEQKNGMLKFDDGKLVKVYGNSDYSHTKDVHRQVANSRDAILKAFQECNKTPLEVDWLIYCPDFFIRNINAPAMDSSRIIDSGKANSLTYSIKHLLSGEVCQKEKLSKIKNFFMQSFNIVPDVSRYIDYQKKTYASLSGGLIELYKNLSLKEKSLRIQGVAGSGKSQLALYAYQNAKQRGLKPLLICFNRPLSDRYRVLTDYKKDGQSCINTFYGLCNNLLESRGEKLNYQEMNKPGFWQDVLNNVITTEFSERDKYDVLIVDEGQDFHAEWFDVLELFLNKEHEMLWLEDEQQRLINIKNKPNFSAAAHYKTSTNYRSPASILEYIKTTIGVNNHVCGNDLYGLGVGIHSYEEKSQQLFIVENIIKQAVKNKIKTEDIVILSCKGLKRSTFFNIKRIGNYALRSHTGNYTTDGLQEETPGDIRFDTIYRFKGQQAPLVILVDIDETEKLAKQDYRNTILCGITRATLRLEIVISKAVSAVFA